MKTMCFLAPVFFLKYATRSNLQVNMQIRHITNHMIYLAPTTKPTTKPTTPELTTKRLTTIQTTTRSVVKGGIRIPSTKFSGNKLIIIVLAVFLLVIVMKCSKNQATV